MCSTGVSLAYTPGGTIATLDVSRRRSDTDHLSPRVWCISVRRLDRLLLLSPLQPCLVVHYRLHAVWFYFGWMQPHFFACCCCTIHMLSLSAEECVCMRAHAPERSISSTSSLFWHFLGQNMSPTKQTNNARNGEANSGRGNECRHNTGTDKQDH